MKVYERKRECTARQAQPPGLVACHLGSGTPVARGRATVQVAWSPASPLAVGRGSTEATEEAQEAVTAGGCFSSYRDFG